HLRVRRLPLVVIAESAAKAPDARGQRRVFNCPAGDIHLVHPLVADIAVAGIPKPVPIVGHQIAVIVLFWRWTEPDIEIERLGGALDRFVADRPARLAAIPLRDQQLAVLARLQGRDLTGPLNARALL